jgi:hypothetical protein
VALTGQPAQLVDFVGARFNSGGPIRGRLVSASMFEVAAVKGIHPVLRYVAQIPRSARRTAETA